MDRGRIDRRGNVHESQIEAAARKLDVADVAHEGNVGIVDGHAEIDLVVERRRVLAGDGGGFSGFGRGMTSGARDGDAGAQHGNDQPQ